MCQSRGGGAGGTTPEIPPGNGNSSKKTDESVDLFSLSDLAKSYTTQLDGLHKMWNYLLVVSGAAITIAWTKEIHSDFVYIILAAFSGYAAVSAIAIYNEHETLVRLGESLSGTRESSPNFRILVNARYFDTTSTPSILLHHLLSDMCVITAIAWRIISVPSNIAALGRQAQWSYIFQNLPWFLGAIAVSLFILTPLLMSMLCHRNYCYLIVQVMTALQMIKPQHIDSLIDYRLRISQLLVVLLFGFGIVLLTSAIVIYRI